jgi:predicted DsbA family dithiol-disulfide isomerase
MRDKPLYKMGAWKMSQDQADLIHIDIVSDVVCPWCVIGYLQLAQAAQETGIALTVRWHPFELNPQMASEGENLREHLAAKYGTTPEGSIKARAQLTQLGAELGFTFDYADDMRMYNTFLAHQLLDWAEETEGRPHALKLALFEAFFTHRKDVSDITVLADIAGTTGHDRKAALAILQSGDRAEATRAKERFFTERGVSGVPAMIFNQQYLVTGAQGVETYGKILKELSAPTMAAGE